MPYRKVPFVNREYYHVFNRGVASMDIFHNDFDRKRFIKTMLYYQLDGPKPRFSLLSPSVTPLNKNGKIINFISYCLMPNHFHFLLQQVKENGITEFISKLSNSYTKYFNTKNKRVGHLLQGEFKAVHIRTNEQLIHVSRYIHLNPLVGYVTRDLKTYPWASFQEYIDLNKNDICSKRIILDQFKSPQDYEKFVLDHEDYARKLESIKHLLLEDPQVQS